MRWNIKREILPLAILVFYVILSVYSYATLPQTIPSHFNFEGKADAFSSKSHVIWLNLGLAIFLYLLLTFIPFIDPFWKRIQNKYNVFLIFRDLALLFFLFFYVSIILSAKAGRLETNILGIGFGLLFVFLGNYLPKLPRNWFFGIRVPWTLSSEIVWKKTHVLSGWLFVLAGVIVILLSLLGVNLGLVLIATLTPLILFTAVIYPLFLYKRLQREENTKALEL